MYAASPFAKRFIRASGGGRLASVSLGASWTHNCVSLAGRDQSASGPGQICLIWAIFYLGTRIDSLGARLDSRSDSLGGRFEYLGTRLDTRMDGLDSRIDGLSSRIDGLTDRVEDQGRQLGSRIDELTVRVEDQGRQLGSRIDELTVRVLSDMSHRIGGLFPPRSGLGA